MVPTGEEGPSRQGGKRHQRPQPRQGQPCTEDGFNLPFHNSVQLLLFQFKPLYPSVPSPGGTGLSSSPKTTSLKLRPLPRGVERMPRPETPSLGSPPRPPPRGITYFLAKVSPPLTHWGSISGDLSQVTAPLGGSVSSSAKWGCGHPPPHKRMRTQAHR